MHRNLQLYFTMAKISAVSFGGGYAVLPILQRELVDKRGWVTTEDLSDISAIAQCTPGVIIVNAATYVGAQYGGSTGALCATLGILTPPMIIMSLVAAFLWPYLQNPWVRHALAGLQACVCALILHAVVKLFRSSVVDLPSFFLFAAALFLSFFTSVSPVILVLSAGLLGLGICRVKMRRGDTTP
jgi:chromate transporter